LMHTPSPAPASRCGCQNRKLRLMTPDELAAEACDCAKDAADD
jgi:hypothetical protein